MIALEPAESKIAFKILSNPNLTQKSKKFLDLKKLLRDQGFILDDGADQIEWLKTQYHRSRKNRDHLSLTIVPTLYCNFNCVYCYQNKRQETISREVEKALLQFIGNKLLKGGGLSVTWFGGEPLLCLTIMERLSNAFIELCQQQGAKYQANIITNGYLLDGKQADRLKQIQITSAQVTIDGPPEVHDQRRPLWGGGHTFKTILENMKEASSRIGINIRMNVDGRNRSSILDLLNVLEKEGLKKRIGFYLGQTYPYTSVCRDVSGWCLNDEDFSLLELETALEMVKRGYISHNIPKAKNYFCMADCDNAYAITPTGGIVKCWNDVANPEMEILNLLKLTAEPEKISSENHLNRDPFGLKCSTCHVLPICMGGCPYIFEKTGQLHCHDWKHHPKENLLFYYYIKKMEQESEIAQALWSLADSAGIRW